MPEIRIANFDDLPVLVALAERTFRDAWQADNDPVEFEQYCITSFTIDQFRDEMLTPGATFYLVEDESGVALAYLKLIADRRAETLENDICLQIERIYVLQSNQSAGLGARLLAFAVQKAQEIGAVWIWLSVWQKSPRSIAFYKKNGFEIFGVETFMVGSDPQPDWLMKRSVTQ
ncbi:MAG: GNAT family N-acetyltransferase [Bacteroidota bacterium]